MWSRPSKTATAPVGRPAQVADGLARGSDWFAADPDAGCRKSPEDLTSVRRRVTWRGREGLARDTPCTGSSPPATTQRFERGGQYDATIPVAGLFIPGTAYDPAGEPCPCPVRSRGGSQSAQPANLQPLAQPES